MSAAKLDELNHAEESAGRRRCDRLAALSGRPDDSPEGEIPA